MKKSRRFYILILILLLLHCVGCASLQDFVGSIFHANTHKDPTDYSLDEKSEYRKYLYEKKTNKKLDDEEILKRLQCEKKTKK